MSANTEGFETSSSRNTLRGAARKRPESHPGSFRTLLHTLRLSDVDPVATFESAVSSRLPGRSVYAVGSGRAALVLTLRSLGIPAGSVVLLSAYNAPCVPNILQAAGYRLKYIDIDLDSLNLDVSLLPDTPPDGTGALLITHMEGSPAQMTAAMDWGRRHGIPVIEDAAHAFGARLNGIPAGSIGDAAIFSLGMGKHLNTLGGGLAVLPCGGEADGLMRSAVNGFKSTSAAGVGRNLLLESVVNIGTNPLIFGSLALPFLRIARNHGKDPMTALFEDDPSVLPPIDSSGFRRISTLQASLGIGRLQNIDEVLDVRRRRAARWTKELSGIICMQKPLSGAEPAWLEFSVRSTLRDRLQKALMTVGLDTQKTWMAACDALPYGGRHEPCPNARRAGNEVFYLPVYSHLGPDLFEDLVRKAGIAIRRELS